MFTLIDLLLGQIDSYMDWWNYHTDRAYKSLIITSTSMDKDINATIMAWLFTNNVGEGTTLSFLPRSHVPVKDSYVAITALNGEGRHPQQLAGLRYTS